MDAAPTPYKPMLRRWYTDRRSLDGGNAWPETIDRDFARFDLDVWAVARRRDRRTDGRLDRLRQLNTWRNAIGHQDFYPVAMTDSLIPEIGSRVGVRLGGRIVGAVIVEDRGDFRGHRIVRVRVDDWPADEAPDFEVPTSELHAAPTPA